jgi:hypothetical protein
VPVRRTTGQPCLRLVRKGRVFLFEFVWEAKFDGSLNKIEPCPHCAEKLMRCIEKRCSMRVAEGSQGYNVIRFSWHLQMLMTWYMAINHTVHVLDIQRDFGTNRGVRWIAA